MTHICVSNRTNIGSDNGLLPVRRQAIIWTNAGILSIGTLGINFSEISIKILKVSLKKMRLKVSSAKWWPFCLGLNVLMCTPVFKGGHHQDTYNYHDTQTNKHIPAAQVNMSFLYSALSAAEKIFQHCSHLYLISTGNILVCASGMQLTFISIWRYQKNKKLSIACAVEMFLWMRLWVTGWRRWWLWCWKW